MGFVAPFLPAIAGAGAGALAKGAAAGSLLATVGPTAAGAIAAGATSLIQGNDPLMAGLDALGGMGIGGAIDDLATLGSKGATTALAAPTAGTASGTLTSFVPREIAENAAIRSVAPGVAEAVSTPLQTGVASLPYAGAGIGQVASDVGSGLTTLLGKGGADAFKAATGNSALTSVGLPAAGLALTAANNMGTLNPMPYDSGYGDAFGDFVSFEDLQRQMGGQGYAQGGVASLNPMQGQFDARLNLPEYREPMAKFADGGFVPFEEVQARIMGKPMPQEEIPLENMGNADLIKLLFMANGGVFQGLLRSPSAGAPASGNFSPNVLSLLQGRLAPPPAAALPAGFTSFADAQSALGYKKGGYLDGPGDGMSDSIKATIEDKQPARLADGEFVVPADVVSHLGNGSTKAGAKRLYSMLDRVRKARTGNTRQGKEIKADKYMPA